MCVNKAQTVSNEKRREDQHPSSNHQITRNIAPIQIRITPSIFLTVKDSFKKKYEINRVHI